MHVMMFYKTYLFDSIMHSMHNKAYVSIIDIFARLKNPQNKSNHVGIILK
jgi:hypothetical protein